MSFKFPYKFKKLAKKPTNNTLKCSDSVNKSSTNRDRVNKGGAIKLNPGHLKHYDQTFAPISVLPSHSSPDRGFVIEFLETSERDV